MIVSNVCAFSLCFLSKTRTRFLPPLWRRGLPSTESAVCICLLKPGCHLRPPCPRYLSSFRPILWPPNKSPPSAEIASGAQGHRPRPVRKTGSPSTWSFRPLFPHLLTTRLTWRIIQTVKYTIYGKIFEPWLQGCMRTTFSKNVSPKWSTVRSHGMSILGLHFKTFVWLFMVITIYHFNILNQTQLLFFFVISWPKPAIIRMRMEIPLKWSFINCWYALHCLALLWC